MVLLIANIVIAFKINSDFNKECGIEMEAEGRKGAFMSRYGRRAQEAITACETLGVQVGDSDESIRRAYRRRAIETHPDKHPDDPLARQKFERVQTAYELLFPK
ncbi:MAG: DnaJ domain-containing protein [bacterium]